MGEFGSLAHKAALESESEGGDLSQGKAMAGAEVGVKPIAGTGLGRDSEEGIGLRIGVEVAVAVEVEVKAEEAADKT